jgi:hypothetical protein
LEVALQELRGFIKMKKIPNKNYKKHISLIFFDISMYFIFFIALYILKRNLLPSNFIFYEGVLISFIAPFFFIFFKNFLYEIYFKDFLIYFLLSYSFIITIPTLIERSISLILLGALVNVYPQGLSTSQLNKIFIEKYVNGDYQIRKRIEEQLANGNLKINNENYILTAQGYTYGRANRRIATILNLDQKYVNPK